jgi:hypothetical protein
MPSRSAGRWAIVARGVAETYSTVHTTGLGCVDGKEMERKGMLSSLSGRCNLRDNHQTNLFSRQYYCNINVLADDYKCPGRHCSSPASPTKVHVRSYNTE